MLSGIRDNWKSRWESVLGRKVNFRCDACFVTNKVSTSVLQCALRLWLAAAKSMIIDGIRNIPHPIEKRAPHKCRHSLYRPPISPIGF